MVSGLKFIQTVSSIKKDSSWKRIERKGIYPNFKTNTAFEIAYFQLAFVKGVAVIVKNSQELSNFKSSVGFEIRADSFSFYSFPTRIFFNAAYGLDKFEAGNQSYGKEWRYYFGLSFGYLD